MAWVTGVLFERDSTMVLVEVLPSGERSNCAPVGRNVRRCSASSLRISMP